jgi:Xaa-Pro aminopeptidase
VQNENPDWPAYKNISCTEHHMGLDTHDYGILTEPMQANMVFKSPEFIFLLKVSEFVLRMMS